MKREDTLEAKVLRTISVALEKLAREVEKGLREPCSVGCPGLGVFDAGFDPPDGWVHIERCDSCGTFEDDEEAAKSISSEVRQWCIDCEGWADECTEEDHSWHVAVPVKDAVKANLISVLMLIDDVAGNLTAAHESAQTLVRCLLSAGAYGTPSEELHWHALHVKSMIKNVVHALNMVRHEVRRAEEKG
jgi:hypothetical protein